MPKNEKSKIQRSKEIAFTKTKHSKTLANFLFREVVDDAYLKYNISDDDMKAMCKKAVNRAAFYLDCVKDEDKLLLLITFSLLYTKDWDNPVETAGLKRLKAEFDKIIEESKTTGG